MKKYNRDKRKTYKTRIRNIHKYDKCDGNDKYKRIHIRIHYDGYNQTEYVKVIYGKTRDTHAQKYVNITNTINDIFPEINEPHIARTYRANAPYRKFIPQQTNYTRPKEEEYTRTIYEYDRVKCIIYDDKLEMIYYGILRRSIYINKDSIEYMLHKGNRSIRVKKFIPFTDKINGVDIKEIMKHNVEIYRI